MEIDILFADPDEALRNLYRHYFGRNGLTIETAADEGECLSHLSVSHPGFLIIDIELFDDEEVFRKRHSSLFADVPVVLVTGDSVLQQLSEASGLPVSHCFRKPYSFLVLLERLRALSSRVDRSFQHRTPTVTHNGEECTEPALSVSRMN